jgi:DNA-binding NarL/FixJ family response regulator
LGKRFSAFDMGERLSILILAKSGRLLNGLQILLQATPSVELIGSLVNGEIHAESDSGRGPDVVLIDDAVLGLDILGALRRISDEWPGVRLIVLAEDVERKGIIDSVGGTETLLKGSPADLLFDAILGHGNQSS